MKQFSLDEYLKDPSRKVVTGDCRNVRIICTDSKIRHYPIIALVEEPNRSENLFSYTEGGQMVSYEPSEKYDLFFAPEKHEGWTLFVNNSESIGPDILDSIICATREEAQRMREADPGRYGAIVKLEWEE